MSDSLIQNDTCNKIPRDYYRYALYYWKFATNTTLEQNPKWFTKLTSILKGKLKYALNTVYDWFNETTSMTTMNIYMYRVKKITVLHAFLVNYMLHIFV